MVALLYQSWMPLESQRKRMTTPWISGKPTQFQQVEQQGQPLSLCLSLWHARTVVLRAKGKSL